MLNANLIEPIVFAAAALTREWVFALHELDARVSAHEYFADTDAQLQAVFSGGTDKWQRHFIDVRLTAQLPLVCQRCLKPVPFALDETVHILLFANEAAADAADAEETADVLVVEEVADVREWVEDQLLMALPVAPHHQDCGQDDLHAGYGKSDNPFAVLKEIAPKSR